MVLEVCGAILLFLLLSAVLFKMETKLKKEEYSYKDILKKQNYSSFKLYKDVTSDFHKTVIANDSQEWSF